jgi:hypothetical protein
LNYRNARQARISDRARRIIDPPPPTYSQLFPSDLKKERPGHSIRAFEIKPRLLRRLRWLLVGIVALVLVVLVMLLVLLFSGGVGLV